GDELRYAQAVLRSAGSGVAACDRAPASERLMNRRMRTRMSGGVGGRRGQPRLLPDWSCGAWNPPPRRFAPPLLDEEGKRKSSPPAEEGQRRRARGAVGWSRASNPTTPALRATPPRRGGESAKTLPSCEGGAESTRPRRRGVVAGLKTPPPRR